MSNETDKKTMLIKLISTMNASDTQQMLAYAAGYEAGKISKISSYTDQQACNQSQTVKIVT